MANNTSRWGLKLAAAAVVLVAAGFTVTYFLRPEAQVVLVKRGKAVDARPGSVVVQAEREADLKSEYGGRILKSDLRPGTKFKAGEFLVQLDTHELELEIQKTQSDMDTAEKRIAAGSTFDTLIANARDDLATKEKQYKLGSLSETDFTEAKRALEHLEQSRELERLDNQQKLDNLKNALKTEQLQLSRMTLTAPFEGVVSTVYASQDDIIAPNQPIAHLITTSRRVGQKASVRFLTYGDPPSNATVAKILPTADPETQRYMVYLNVEIPPEKLVPGITGEASIDVGEHENTLIVPRRAVSGHNLLVVDGGRVELRRVELGFASLNEVEVLSGVRERDAVIAEQLDQFQPGDHVRTSVEKE